jgi:mannose-6-phosphate isomerase-like protein (cupin superfamily)
MPGHSGPDDDLARFLAAAASAIAGARRDGSGLPADLDAVSAALAAPAAERVAVVARARPACRHLAAALALGEAGPAAHLVGALRPLVDGLCWCHDYDVDEALPAFSRNLAYAEVAGPFGGVPSRDLCCGLLLMAPGTLYPAHAHAASELYHVLGGRARWQRGGEPWAQRPPGAFILHPSGVAHAMETEAEPLLALYVWYGDMAGAVAFTEGALAGRDSGGPKPGGGA